MNGLLIANNTLHPQYNEAAALQQLLQALSATLKHINDRYEHEEGYHIDEQMTITVGGVSTAFSVGGPQSDALVAFISHIASENFYAVDTVNDTVTE